MPTLHPKSFPVSWDQFHRDCRALAWRLADHPGVEEGAEQGAGEGAAADLARSHGSGAHASAPRWRAIVTITRGGLVPAAIISRELEIRVVETVGVASYHDYDQQGELEVLKTITPDLLAGDGSDVLIIDDLVDTGATARAVRDMLPRAHLATVYAKPLGRPEVDTYVTAVSQDTWIYFPWDLGMTFQEPIVAPQGT